MFNNIRAIKKFDPAAKSYLEIILCYPGLHALWLHKIAHLLYRMKLPLLPRLLNYFTRMFTGIDIHPGAQIANGIMIDHGQGVVIGETAIIEEGCLIYQGVTLGGTGKESGKRHPTLRRNVVVGAGAKILGNIVMEENSRVGAGSVVMRNVPKGCTVVGIPGKIVRTTSEDNVDGMLDHSQMPDPVAKVFAVILEKIEAQQKLINKLSEKQKEHDSKLTDKEKDDNIFLQDFMHGEGI
ncbi:serine O-acetyltransferase [Leptospira sp. GIMC2001]|uniref:serine O-acetyltransferase n=1 Tax=Leptospira sp. GIMC2001 TaxID=1513297 RepID=UPI00234929B9|nr:serine O-acetyltransferase [Leptospira sp. GIMC2001]WCL49441.1 serine O-acetyltransferase [Leptospira sp. GIMC2001]